MRATDRWAIEERGVPSLDLMERAGEGLARVVDDVAPTAASSSSAAGATTAATGSSPRGCCAQAGRERRRAARRATPASCRATRRPTSTGCASRRRAVRGRPRSTARPWSVDALLGTGFSGEPREPVRGAIVALNDCPRRSSPPTCPSGVDASTGAVDGAAVRAPPPPRSTAPSPGCGSTRQGHAGASTSSRSASRRARRSRPTPG